MKHLKTIWESLKDQPSFEKWNIEQQEFERLISRNADKDLFEPFTLNELDLLAQTKRPQGGTYFWEIENPIYSSRRYGAYSFGTQDGSKVKKSYFKKKLTEVAGYFVERSVYRNPDFQAVQDIQIYKMRDDWFLVRFLAPELAFPEQITEQEWKIYGLKEFSVKQWAQKDWETRLRRGAITGKITPYDFFQNNALYLKCDGMKEVMKLLRMANLIA